MQPFKWTKAHAVFLPEVDAEHRNLYRLAEELQQSVDSHAQKTRIRNQLQSLTAALDEHFAHEERLMKASRCQSFDWHKQQHNTVRRQAKRSAKLFADGNAAAPVDFLAFLARWFRDHMALSDRMMGAQVRNRDRFSSTAW